MTLPPIDQHINQNIPEYTQDKFKLEGSSVIEKDEEYKGYLTIARNVTLHGKEYTIRKYVKKDSNLEGKSSEIILQMYEKDMGDMVIKMVNLAIAYNLGKTKAKSGAVISEIAISQDQSQILRNFETKKDDKERPWTQELNRKLTRYTNEKEPKVLNDPTSETLVKDKVTEKKRALEILLAIFPQVQPDPATSRVVFNSTDKPEAEAEKAKTGKKGEDKDHLEVEEIKSDDDDAAALGTGGEEPTIVIVPAEEAVDEEEVDSDEEEEANEPPVGEAADDRPPVGSISAVNVKIPQTTSTQKAVPPQASIEIEEDDEGEEEFASAHSVLGTESSPDQIPPEGSMKPTPSAAKPTENQGSSDDRKKVLGKEESFLSLNENEPSLASNKHLEYTPSEIDAIKQAEIREKMEKERASKTLADANANPSAVSDQKKHSDAKIQLKKDEERRFREDKLIAEEEQRLEELARQIQLEEQALNDEIKQSQAEEKKKGPSDLEPAATEVNQTSVVSTSQLEKNRQLISDMVANRMRLMEYLSEEFTIWALQGRKKFPEMPQIPQQEPPEKYVGMNEVEAEIKRNGNFVLQADVFIEAAKKLLELETVPTLEQLKENSLEQVKYSLQNQLQDTFKTVDGILIRLRSITNIVHDQLHDALGIDLKDPNAIDAMDPSKTDLNQTTVAINREWLLGLRKSILDSIIRYDGFDKLEKPQMVDVFNEFQRRNELLKPLFELNLSNTTLSENQPYSIKQFAKELVQIHTILNSPVLESSLRTVVEAMDKVTPGYKDLVYDLQPQLREFVYGKPKT